MVRSPLQTALLVGAVIAVGVVAGILGFPSAGVVIFTSGVGSSVLIGDRNKRRVAAARDRAGTAVEGFPLQLIAERVAVGRPFQFRLVGPTKALWAPGILYLREGEARFVPSRDDHSDRAWGGAVDRSEVLTSKLTGASVRLFGRDGSTAQFVLNDPPANVAEAIPAWVDARPAGGPSL